MRAGALTGSLAVALSACGGSVEPASDRDFRDLPADQVMFDAAYDIKDMGTLRARLHSDTALVFEDSATVLWRPLDLRLYDVNGSETAHVTAVEGELDSRTNAMVARGDVVLVTTNGRRILTEELHYDPRTGRIWSDVRTVMFEGETRVEGRGFSADEKMENVEVFKATGENIQIEF